MSACGDVVNIRAAKAQDSAALAQIQVNSYRTAYANILPQAYLDRFTYAEQEQDWRDLLSSGLDDVLTIAETSAGEIVGYALGRAGSTEIPPYDGELVAWHVRPSYQEQGTGRRLFLAVAKQLKHIGSASLMLWVLEKNPARVFYERLGGQVIGEKDWGDNAAFGVVVKEVAYGWSDIDQLAGLGAR
jgi:GNAT superfamily N-acetyltransferase